MDEDTSPTRAQRREHSDTAPTRPHEPDAGDTSPHRAQKRSRRARNGWGWRLIAVLLAAAVALNLCLTTGVWLNYY
ncbi:MAG: hypothetical protein HY260_23110, partial [Chloroflexi bacterium]|nr:hypothetical protein [Chloroflexota bacterium]